MGIIFLKEKKVIPSALLSFLPLVPKVLPQRIKEESSKGGRRKVCLYKGYLYCKSETACIIPRNILSRKQIKKSLVSFPSSQEANKKKVFDL